MAEETINYIDILTPSIKFNITREDGVSLQNYTLSWNGGQYEGSKIYTDAKLIPTGINIVFTPTAVLPTTNKIVQYKWTFGDGMQAIANDDMTNSTIVHNYAKGLGGTTGSPTCLIATLTAIDKFYRHVRAYKTIYLYD